MLHTVISSLSRVSRHWYKHNRRTGRCTKYAAYHLYIYWMSSCLEISNDDYSLRLQ